MTERLIDAVCPHCGRLGTTVRVVLHEDGFTKLSRRCTDCAGEWVNSFDHDWLAGAKNKKLQADNERLAHEIERLTRERDEERAEVERLRGVIRTIREAWHSHRKEGGS